MTNSDPTGESVLVTLLFVAAGAAINVATTWLAATITGQSYSFVDGCVAALSGAFCGLGGGWIFAAGLVSGVYSGIMSYLNGAEWWGSLIAGLASGYFTMAGIGNLANIPHTLSNLGIQAFVDFIFCTGYNSMSAGVYKAVTPGKTESDSQNVVDVVPQPNPTVPYPVIGGGGGVSSSILTKQMSHCCL